MRRFRRPPSLPKSPRNLFVWRSPITPTRRPYPCWRSLCRILSSTGTLQLELPLGLEDEKRRPGSQRGMARWTADRAIDLIRDRFGWDAVGYGSVMLGLSRSVPDEFRELAEKNL